MNELNFKVRIISEIYYKQESSWGTYRFSTEDDIPYYETMYDGTKELKVSSLVGNMQELVIGGEYLVKATYTKHKTYGDQYNPISVCAVIPKSYDNQLLFLQSLINKGVAERLLQVYPELVNDVIKKKVDNINYSKVKGVGEKTWLKIKDKIITNYVISDIITMLRPVGVTFNMIRKLLEGEPNPSILKNKIEDNPYYITSISGISFKKADDFALKIKPEFVDSVERLGAFVSFYLRNIGESDGHTWCSVDILKQEIINNVPECANKFKWPKENNSFLHIDGNKIGLQYYYDIEMKVQDLLLQHSVSDTRANFSDEQIEKAIKTAELEQGYEYVSEQLDAIRNSLKRSVSIITGCAGVGKSSIMRAILMAYKQNHYTIAASALSAMAAKRITEATGFPAATIHRTLGCTGLNKYMYNKDAPLLADVAFLDEGSMVNAKLFLDWLEAIGPKTRIIIAGDHKQLPPIGYGNIFSDILDKLGEDIINRLVKPMRQAQRSGILMDANMIRDNYNPITEKLEPKLIHGELQDMYYVFRNNKASLNQIAIKTYLKSIEELGTDDVVIITPRKQGCLNSSNEINKVIQDELLKDELSSITSLAGNEFKLGTKVVQTVNDYEKNVFNGEVGYITKIGTNYEEKKAIEYCEVNFPNKIIEYQKKELGTLELAYALTCHRVQGSGFHTVIGIIDSSHFNLLDNCMLYTLITRAKKRCLLLAEPQAFDWCIKTSHNNRNTWLSLEK